jgi:hypothetical protein
MASRSLSFFGIILIASFGSLWRERNSFTLFGEPAHDCNSKPQDEHHSSLFITNDDDDNNNTSRPCPPFHQKGGIMIFFHIPKAGGTTVRRLFQRGLSNHVILYQRISFTKALPEMKRHLEQPIFTKTLVVEIHDGPNLSLVEMAPFLHQLRQRANANNVPFFCFTLVRQAFPYMISYYNYEHLFAVNAARFERGTATEEDFRRLSLQDPQCLFLTRSEWAFGRDWEVLRRNFSTKECIDLYPIMQQSLDWIGTVEDMQTNTLPLLSFLVTRNATIGRTFEPQNVARISTKTPPHIELLKLSNATVEYIHNITQGDDYIYKKVQRDYPMSMWNDFDNESA